MQELKLEKGKAAFTDAVEADLQKPVDLDGLEDAA